MFSRHFWAEKWANNEPTQQQVSCQDGEKSGQLMREWRNSRNSVISRLCCLDNRTTNEFLLTWYHSLTTMSNQKIHNLCVCVWSSDYCLWLANAQFFRMLKIYICHPDQSTCYQVKTLLHMFIHGSMCQRLPITPLEVGTFCPCCCGSCHILSFWTTFLRRPMRKKNLLTHTHRSSKCWKHHEEMHGICLSLPRRQ